MLEEKKSLRQKNALRLRPSAILRGIGIVLISFATLGWLSIFPFVQLIKGSLNGKLLIPAEDRILSGFSNFLISNPQSLWFSFIIGIILLFILTPYQIAESNDKQDSTLRIAGLEFRLPQWLYFSWRLVGIAALVAILAVAAVYRIGDARDIGATDLVRTDYDEGVHAETALLLAHGKQLYHDFFFGHPVGGALLWSLPLRLEGAEWGSLYDFLRVRLFTSLVSLLTIALVYLTGRRIGGKWAGPVAGAIAALALAIDGGAIRAEQQILLEPLVNFFSVLALCLFVHFDFNRNGRSRLYAFGAPALVGFVAGLAFSVKVPALTLIVALGLTLVIWRRWQALGFYALGGVVAFLLVNGYYLLTSGSDFIKQVYLWQLLRPANDIAVTSGFTSLTTTSAIDYMYGRPYLAFTLLGACLGLVAIVIRWVSGKGGQGWIPVVLLAIFTTYLYTGKAFFFPHYYDQMALPLALLAGGIINFWRVEWWRGRLSALMSGAIGLALLVVLAPSLLQSNAEPSKPEWNLQRAVADNFQKLQLPNGAVMALDTRYNFILGKPLQLDGYNRYAVDGVGYVEHIGLGLDKLSLGEALRKTFFESKQSRSELQKIRGSDEAQENWYKNAANSDFIVLGDFAKSLITPDTLSRIGSIFINRVHSNEIDVLNSIRFIGYQSGALFGDKIRLLGFDTVAEIKLKAGENKIPLTVFWRGETPISENYTVFIHLLDQNGQKVAQRDTEPRYGATHTSNWKPGEILDDDQSVPISADLPPGKYRIKIGLYRPSDFKGLEVTEVPTTERIEEGNLILLDVTISK